MNPYRIKFIKSAKKELVKLPKDIQKRIAAKLNSLSQNPYSSDTKKLKNGGDRFRVRVGDYRIIYKIENDQLVILIVKVGHRRDIYS
ncbi:MAG: type II toxin-antitoxin system RelE/ParE family toxin [Cyanobacteria bacterium P01_G01_bin.54]